MRDDRFDWDDGKVGSNLRDHKVYFGLARSAFDDLLALSTKQMRTW